MSDILIHTRSACNVFTINRIAKKNLLTPAMYAALAHALTASAPDDAVRVTVIQGMSRCLCQQ